VVFVPRRATRDEAPQWLCESLVVDPVAAGQMHRIAVRVSGGLFAEQGRPGAAPDPARR
jgi:hypothetical protein